MIGKIRKKILPSPPPEPQQQLSQFQRSHPPHPSNWALQLELRQKHRPFRSRPPIRRPSPDQHHRRSRRRKLRSWKAEHRPQGAACGDGRGIGRDGGEGRGRSGGRWWVGAWATAGGRGGEGGGGCPYTEISPPSPPPAAAHSPAVSTIVSDVAGETRCMYCRGHCPAGKNYCPVWLKLLHVRVGKNIILCSTKL